MSARDLVRSRSLRLLDYLTALAAERRGAPRRQLADYSPTPLAQADLPTHPGVRLGPTHQRESWLEVARVPAPAAPRWPPGLDPYLAGTVVTPDAPPVIPAHLLPSDPAGDEGLAAPGLAIPAARPAEVSPAASRAEEAVPVPGPAAGDPAPGDPAAGVAAAGGDGPGVGAPTDEGLGRPSGRVRAELDAWVRAAWAPWAPVARSARDARALYQRLFDLRLHLQREAATQELVWGHSVLCWRVGEAVVAHPLLVTRLVVTVDPDSGVLRLHPDSPTTLETEPLHGLGLPGLDELSALRDRLRAAPPDPWDPEARAELHRQIVAPLGLDAQVVPGPRLPVPGRDPLLVDAWAVYARPRPALQGRFYAELRDALAEGDFLPEAIASVVADEALVAEALGDEPQPDAAGRSGPAGSADLGERLLMPLATNADQERIARQLAGARGVTVQGPPGTGKSHTIANMICHLVAHGQRVLVTAQDEQALSVLRDKIPPELRNLTVAVLGSSRADLDELRAAVVEISGAVTDVDAAREAGAVKVLAEELDAARASARTLELRMVDLLAREAHEFDLPQGRERAPEVAAWLAERADELGFVPDRIGPTTPPPLRGEEFAELYRLAREIDPADARTVAQVRPAPPELPSAATLGRLFDELDEVRRQLAGLGSAGLSIHALERLGPDGVRALLEDTTRAARLLAQPTPAWLAEARRQCAASTAQGEFWADQATRLAADVEQLHQLTAQTFGRAVTLPDGDPRVQLTQLADLRDRFAAGRGLPRLGGRELRALHDGIRVDGLAPRTGVEVELARAEVRRRQLLAAAVTRQAAIAGRLGGEPVDPAAPDAITRLDAAARDLGAAVAWEREAAPALSARLRAVFPAGPDRPGPADLDRLAGVLAAASGHRRESELAGELTAVERRLADESSGRPDRAGRGGPLWAALREALDRRDLAAWTSLLEENARLAALRPEIERRDALAARLRTVAPLWADAVLAGRGAPGTCGDPARVDELWRWRQAQSWLEELHAGGDLAVLGRQLADASEVSRRLVLEVARRAARLALAARLGDEQRRALTGWVQALDRIGKGTGKYAARWRAEARTHMAAAMGAVPVWIMPTHRVMESFDPGSDDLFDVVIVDESSQCDVLSLGVLSLGRKAVVVGDDAQTSPDAVGVERSRVHALIEAHLPDVAQRSLLDVEASLYDTAARVFPRTVVLKEHFRCLPEIIGFSNRFYDHQILPLREDPELGLGAPLRPVRVDGGGRVPTQFGDANPVEAHALVDQVVSCCADPAYDGMTMGVVTLLGAGQPRLIEHALVERLGEPEFERRRTRVGDPYHFQGDERDVIFISVVADDNRFAATRRRDLQRINVAASRARNQMWVFHTVDPTTLRDDDARRQLIEYLYAGRTAQLGPDLAERCESDFERAVLREILARGYRVRPQHPVGRYRIDLVVESAAGAAATGPDELAFPPGHIGPETLWKGKAQALARPGARLAVECDGDRFHGPEQWEADLRRQRILERLGWTFWRIRGSEFYRHPQRSLDGLWQRLDQLGIRPGLGLDQDRRQDG